MPDLEPLSFSTRDGLSEKDDFDVKSVCSGRRHPRVWLCSPSPCLNAAVYHVQELKSVMESWSQKLGNPPQQREGGWHRTTKALRFYSQSEECEELFVKGFSITVSDKQEAVCFIDAPSSCPLWKRIHNVLDEVVHLVERLEADRQKAHEAHSKEKSRKRFLEDKLNISLKTQREHSFAIHKEQEVCVRDVSELKFHLKVERQKVDKVQQSVWDSERLNQLLNTDVNLNHTQIPIIRENMDSKRATIKVIQRLLMEAEALWSKKQGDLALIEKCLKEMDCDLHQEMRSFEKALFGKKNQLEKKVGDLIELRQLEEDICAKRSAAESRISILTEKQAVLTIHIPEVMQKEKTAEEEISQLLQKVEVKIKSNRELKETLSSLQDVVDKKWLEGEENVSHTKEQLQSNQNLSLVIVRENLQQKLRLLDYEAKISDSESAVRQMHEERKRMIQKINSNAEQWEKAKAEVNQVTAKHSVTSTMLEEQERRSFTEKQNTQKLIGSLRKGLNAHIISQQLLKTHCVQINEELKNLQRTLAQTNKQLDTDFEDVSVATKALENKLEKMLKLTEGLEMFEYEHRQTLFKIEKQKNELQDQLRAAQVQEQAIRKTFEKTEALITDVKEKREESHSSSVTVQTMVENMPEVIAQLQNSLKVVEYKHRASALLMSCIQTLMDTSDQRTQRSEWIYSDHRAATREQVKETQDKLTAALKENQLLASTYTDVQRVLKVEKQETLTALSRKNHVQEMFQFFTELSMLQRTMNEMCFSKIIPTPKPCQ